MAEMRYTKRGKVAEWRKAKGLFVPLTSGQHAFVAVLPDRVKPQGRTICPAERILDKGVSWLEVEVQETPDESARVFCKVYITGPASDAQYHESINVDPAWVYTADEKAEVSSMIVAKAKAAKAAKANTNGAAKAAEVIKAAKATT